MSLVFEEIKVESHKKLDELKTEIDKIYKGNPAYKNICVYACGSMGRLDMTENSDLDLFFVTMDKEEIIKTNNHLFFADLYRINNNLGYQDPSKGGEYWDFISEENLLDIGSRQEDYNNSFTARMLLILESKPIFNEDAYNRLVNEVITKYFADYADYKEKGFYPLFLMNDIFRYWYTLTLNYEYRRDATDDVNKRYWKRLKLKYARLITCYSMIACLYKKSPSPEYVAKCIKTTPFERLALVAKDDTELHNTFTEIEKEYEWFLDLRSQDSSWWDGPNNKKTALTRADAFHNLVLHDFMKQIASTNPHLRDKTDIY